MTMIRRLPERERDRTRLTPKQGDPSHFQRSSYRRGKKRRLSKGDRTEQDRVQRRDNMTETRTETD